MRLKRLRVLISLLVLALTSALFLDIHATLPDGLAGWVLYPQLVPSLILMLGTAGWAATGFVLVLILTLLFGRVYCSTLCPLGTLQDIVIRLAGRRPRGNRQPHRRFRYRPSRTWLRHGVLALVVVSALLGWLLPLALLDPFSIFGRTLAQLVRPLVIGTNDLAGRVLELVAIYALPPAGWPHAAAAVLALALGTLALIVVMSARHGRLFCNTLCPVGTLLGLIGRHAAWRIRIDDGRCTQCGECALVCKAGCIDLRRRRVDAERCVLCFNCMAGCPGSGIGLRPAWRQGGNGAPAIPFDPSRRLLLAGGIACALGAERLGALSTEKTPTSPPRNRLPTRIPVPERPAIAPPGAGSTARFNARCTACGLCVSACPTRVIQPALLAYGPAGLFQPTLDFAAGFCTYDCVRCTGVCPTGAIAPLSVDGKHQVQLGQVEFIEDNCVVITDLTACGACAEHCPTKAVRMVPYRPERLPGRPAPSANLTIPELDQAICVGCGACEHVCPTRPHRAIYVRGEPVHAVAQPPPDDLLPLPHAPAGGSVFPF